MTEGCNCILEGVTEGCSSIPEDVGVIEGCIPNSLYVTDGCNCIPVGMTEGGIFEA